MKAALKTKAIETQPEESKGSLGIVETRQFTFAEGAAALKLESGETLGPVTLAYETYGTLNAEKSNAILVLHALSGDAHAAGLHRGEKDPGWWDAMIGPGKPFDTDCYFVICSNVIGGCKGSTGPSSANPQTGKPYGTDFPFVTIGDMVQAQRHLIERMKREAPVPEPQGSGNPSGPSELHTSHSHPEAVDD